MDQNAENINRTGNPESDDLIEELLARGREFSAKTNAEYDARHAAKVKAAALTQTQPNALTAADATVRPRRRFNLKPLKTSWTRFWNGNS